MCEQMVVFKCFIILNCLVGLSYYFLVNFVWVLCLGFLPRVCISHNLISYALTHGDTLRN